MAIGQEFLVNTNTTNYKEKPTVAGLTDGGFVVVWHSIGQDGDQGGVYGQRYDANGNPQGNEFQIHTTVTGQQLNPSIAALTDGGFVVTWDSSTPSSSYYYDVYGQVFNSDGSTQGNEFLVNTYTTVHQLESSVTGLSDGRFVATWDSFDQDSSREGVFGQIYNADGTLYGSEFQVNTYTWVRQSDISVTDLGDGGFVVTWHSYAQDGHDNGIFGQIYNPNGTTQGNEFQINSHTTGHQSQPSVAGLNDGGFVVSWESISQDGSFYGIYAQIYNADGTTQGSEFKVNTYTTGSQFISSVTALSDGGFVVVWVSDDQDGSDYGVFAQKFNADGSQNGGELQVNESTDGNQSHPSVAALDNGDFVVTWDSTGTDAGIRSRIFSDAVDPTGTVTITGIGDIGETLTADTSTLADVYGLGTLSYQWLRAGVAISGATSATYDVVAADEGYKIKVLVSYTSGAYYEEETTSKNKKIEGFTGVDLLGTGVADTLTGTEDNDRLRGRGGNDVLIGLNGQDKLAGAGGADTIDGGRNRDIINGGTLNDVLSGGGGIDTFVFQQGHGHDTITDFRDGKDILRIDTPGLTFADVTVTQTGADVLVSFLDVQITLVTETAANITDADFQFL